MYELFIYYEDATAGCALCKQYLVLLSSSLLVVLQNVVSDVVLGVDQQGLCLALLLSALHPHHK